MPSLVFFYTSSDHVEMLVSVCASVCVCVCVCERAYLSMCVCVGV